MKSYGSTPPITESIDLSKLRVPSKNDISSSKYLEDYYWAFRANKQKLQTRSFKNFKKTATKRFKPYVPILRQGEEKYKNVKYKTPRSCKKIKSFDRISLLFSNLFLNTCLNNSANAIFNNTGKLEQAESSFIEQHLKLLLSYRYRSDFITRIEEVGPRDKVFISNLLREFILTTKTLPSKPFLKYLIVDQTLTSFIQKNNLLDESSQFTKEFRNLVKNFKREYLLGNEELAKEYLEYGIDFYEQNKDQISDADAWALFITSGKRLARKADYNLAMELFKLSERTSDHDKINESKFQTIFALYRDRKLSSARNFIKNEKFVSKFNTLNSKLRYWIAHIYEKSKEYKKAKELYLEQIKYSPLSFYSILALKNLRRMGPDYGVDLLVKSEYPEIRISDLSEQAKDDIFLFDIFKQAGSGFFTNLQASQVRGLKASSFFKEKSYKDSIESKIYFLIKFFSNRDSHLNSFKVAYTNLNKKLINLNSLVIESLFPQKYSSLINGKGSKVDTKVILSLIRQESAFNERARSTVGARGLMQIMPATGRQFVKNLKASKLYNPSLNIQIGARYLENLLVRFDGDLIFALSAYNAGMGNVGKWQKTIPFGSDLISNIEMIPFKETRNYVKLIYRNLFFYNLNSGEASHLDLPINSTFKVTLN